MSAARLHVEGRSWNRRVFLQTAAGTALWPLLSAPASALAPSSTAIQGYPFKLGVASGDPTPDGFVIWTRLAPQPLETCGGMPKENVSVGWEVAADDSFKKIAVRGTAVATPELAYSVHVEVPGLAPHRPYWYRFTAAGDTSPVGRARTAPSPDDSAQRLRFAFASCSHWESGLFTAYQHMAQEDLDLIAHLGDYIYEGEGKKNRVRKHHGPVLETLKDYRARHAQYKTDKHLQAAHAHCTWLVTWDDHEFFNNCAVNVAEHSHVRPADFLNRRAAAYQAYYEHMPLRAAQFPTGPHMKLYRHVGFGTLAEFAILDTRQYRTNQPNGGGNSPITPAALASRATLLGTLQEQWLYKTLEVSQARWNVLAQQVMMARADRKQGAEKLFSMDQWPGYEANRQRLLKFFAASQLNPVVITGDIHSNWVNDLQVDERQAGSAIVATEFVCTSITSKGNGKPNVGTPAVMNENPFVRFYSDERGYVSCDVTPKTWTSHYRAVPEVEVPGGPVVTRKTFVVEHGKPGAQKA